MSTLTSAVGQGPEQLGGDAGLVGHAGDGDLGLGGVADDPGDDGLFHVGLLLGDPGARLPGEGRADVQRARRGCGRTRRPAWPAWGSRRRTSRASRRSEMRFIRRASGTTRGSVVNTPGHVGVELADAAERLGQGDRGGVGAAPTEEGDVAGRWTRPGRRRPPGPGRRRAPARMRSARTSRILAFMWVVSVMNPAWLPVKESARHAEVVQRHAQQGGGLALAGGDEHVHLAAGPGLGDLAGQVEQVVGLLAHGRDDHHDLVAPAHGAGHVVGDLADALGVGDRGATELLHDEGHGAATVPAGRRGPQPVGRPRPVRGSASGRRGSRGRRP